MKNKNNLHNRVVGDSFHKEGRLVKHKLDSVHGIVSAKPSSSIQKGKLGKLKSELVKAKEGAQSAINEFNKKYPTAKITLENLKDGIKKAKEITNKLANDPNVKKALDLKTEGKNEAEIAIKLGFQAIPTLAKIRQLLWLGGLYKKIEAYQNTLKKVGKIENKEISSYANILEARDRGIKTMSTQKTSFQKEPQYRSLKANYRNAYQFIFRRNSQFDSFYKNSTDSRTGSQEIATKKEKETEKLLFSILAEQSNGFKDFIFKGMGSDWKKNKEKYPFIYYEWIKTKGVDTRRINQAKTNSEKLLKQLGFENQRSLVEGVKNRIQTINAAINTELGSQFKISNQTLNNLPTQTNAEYYMKLESALKALANKIDDIIQSLKKKGSPSSLNLANSLIKDKERFKEYAKWSYSQLRYESLQSRLIKQSEGFTIKELSKASESQTMMRLAMLKLKKAIAIVDQPNGPNGASYRSSFHPSVRRQLIAMVYREGVARYENGKIKLDVSQEYRWTLSQLAQSSLFNRQVPAKFLSPEQRDFLIVARYANEAQIRIEFIRTRIIKKLDEIKGKIERKNTIEKKANKTQRETSELNKLKKSLKTQINEINNDLGYGNSNAKLTTANFLSKYSSIKKKESRRLKTWATFQKKAATLMQNPSRAKLREFIEELKNGQSIDGLKKVNRKFLNEYATYTKNISVHYATFDFQEKSQGNYLEMMGIRIEGIYIAYKKYIEKNPKVKVDHWDDLMTTSAGVKMLKEMLSSILQKGTTPQSREAFLKVFSTIQDKSITNPKLRNSQDIARNIFGLIKEDIKHREAIEGKEFLGLQKAVKALEGSTFGDNLSGYAKSVINMAIGPGQSIANRAAGAILILGIWKGIKEAYKGETKIGKAGRIFALAAAVELFLKNTHGEGLTDKMSLTGLSDKLKGTKEDVLIQQMVNRNVDITKTEHAGALLVMKEVSMIDLMKWYEATDEFGQPKTGGKGSSKKASGDAKLPRKIASNLYKIVRGSSTTDKEPRARFIIKKVMKNFFYYVGGKDQKDATAGMKIVKNAWINPAINPDFKPKKGDRIIPDTLIKKYKANPQLLTWKEVINGEIRSYDTTKVAKEKYATMTKNWIRKNADKVETWGRDAIVHKWGVGADVFWKYVKEDQAPKIQALLIKAGEAGARNLRYGVDHVKFMYGKHEVTLRRLWNNTWEFTGNAVQLPIFATFKSLDWLMSKGNMKVRQLKKILDQGKTLALPPGDRLSPDHVVDNDQIRNKINNHNIRLADLMNLKKNPEFIHFGRYQIPFYRAAQANRDNYPKTYVIPNHTDERRALLEGFSGTKYSILQTKPSDLGSTAGMSKEKIMMKMHIKSREQAKQHFLRLGASPSDIKYMYAIHYKPQYDRQGNPVALYTYWRLPGGVELTQKRNGTWPGPYNPNSSKYQPPFIVDPSKGIAENLKIFIGMRNPTVRKVGAIGTIAAGQWTRAMLGLISVPGSLVAGASNTLRSMIPDIAIQHFAPATAIDSALRGVKEWTLKITHRKEKTYQSLDEISGSAIDNRLASSAFYKVARNARIYNRALKWARENGKTMSDVMKMQNDPTTRRPWNWTAIPGRKRIRIPVRKKGRIIGYKTRRNSIKFPYSQRPNLYQ